MRNAIGIAGALAFTALLTVACAPVSTGGGDPTLLTTPSRTVDAPDPSPTISAESGTTNRRGPYRVVRVADGDTLTVRIGAALERIRVVGINTPESIDPRQPVQCFGREASAQAKALLTGTSVWLERDETQGERDKYGRLLAFVWLDDVTDFGLKMIRDGFALEYTYKLPYRNQVEYQRAQASAKALGAGLWSQQTCAGDTTRAA